MYQRKYSEKLQIYPRVTQLLKSYNAGYERNTASQFSKEELNTFLQNDELKTPFWVTRKAIAVLMISGGLRLQELKDIQFTDLVKKTTHTR